MKRLFSLAVLGTAALLAPSSIVNAQMRGGGSGGHGGGGGGSHSSGSSDFTLQDHPDFTLQDHPDSIPRVELDSIQQVRLDSALLVLPGLGLLVDLSASDRVAFDPWEVPVSTHLERTLPVCGQFPQEADLLE